VKLVQLIDEDFVNYKKASMVLGFPYCSFKCEKECGCSICQNSKLAQASPVEISAAAIVDRYVNNPITDAIVMQGLEPLDSLGDVIELVTLFSEKSNDDIVIYTGYTESEAADSVSAIADCVQQNKLIIKFGRFIPNAKHRLDPILGVELASDNQYAKEVS